MTSSRRPSSIGFQIICFSAFFSVVSLIAYHQLIETIITNKNDVNNLSPPSFSYLPHYFQEEAIALPSVPATKEETEALSTKRKIYGGQGDKSHLGGFTELDLDGISPSVWKDMITYFGVKSLLDLGCGKGVSTLFFALHGVDVICAEGSHDAVTQTLLPDPERQVVEHDFSRGPWWPKNTVDAVWCVEFLEHVGRNFHRNYLPAFKKAALVFASHSTWGGWHHVEVHKDEWWIAKFEAYGLRYSKDLTERVRTIAREERGSGTKAFNGKSYGAAHIIRTTLVFINPLVASLPQHEHLFAEPGCFTDYDKPNHHCGKGKGVETPIPPEYKPLEINESMEIEWKRLVNNSLVE